MIINIDLQNTNAQQGEQKQLSRHWVNILKKTQLKYFHEMPFRSVLYFWNHGPEMLASLQTSGIQTTFLSYLNHDMLDFTDKQCVTKYH